VNVVVATIANPCVEDTLFFATENFYLLVALEDPPLQWKTVATHLIERKHHKRYQYYNNDQEIWEEQDQTSCLVIPALLQYLNLRNATAGEAPI